MTTDSKAELRRAMRAKRNALTETEQKLAAQRLAAQVTATRWFRVSRRIACYIASDGEIDPAAVLERIWQTRKHAYLPVLSRLTHDRLWFARATPGVAMTLNRFNIPEPRVPARELIRAEELDLVLLPLVAFDPHGNRLGRGAAFYDRSLAFLNHRKYLRKPHLLGLAHEFQRVARLAVDSWDIPLDGVVTDQAVYYTDTKGQRKSD